ncbi:MAG: hypothetical protein IJT54_10040 [Candidatus Methanomethylophilaceae archaeon]|nr:hypothetical protein [Candidatus Methanomethylophilaceae archaeon]
MSDAEDKRRLSELKAMHKILERMWKDAKELEALDSRYDTYNTGELKQFIDNMAYWLREEIKMKESHMEYIQETKRRCL